MISLEWVEGRKVYGLLRSIQNLPGSRRTRLLAVAFCDRVAHFLPNEESREWIEVARRYADKKASRAEMVANHAEADRAYSKTCEASDWLQGLAAAAQLALQAVMGTVRPTNRYYAGGVAESAAHAAGLAVDCNTSEVYGIPVSDPLALAAESAAQLQLLRDVLGRPDGLSLSQMSDSIAWQGGLVPKLARSIYDDRAFDQMPILGDALEDAGCGDDAILAHCRSPGPHTRGCWVVDLILGKQ